MKNMRYLISIALVLTMCFGLVACKSNKNSNENR
jgi:hypothetical protein